MLRGTLLPGAPPTAAALERHAARFGPAGVAETASEYGLSVSVGRAKRKRKVRGPSLKKRVAALLADGHDAEVIAEMEDITPGKARRLVAELSR